MRFSAAFALALPAIALATAVPRGDSDGGSCNTGPISCCNSVQQATPQTVNLLQGLLGIVLGPITGLIGLNCSPLDILGVGGNSCSSQPVCCTNNQFNGLINLGCTPININL
ncbi:hypothetical protein NP233_g384 [Leucocoprinus birnbaumii]|uniref:Hydrophobin n=1 Tax=Leucocoprinus birnbaumii TaxID=56174 RepID=A0AAD5YWR3_9AGAR|nr:hypothetical protein NP233_g11088 [Leucocoprinus birnbaumii]KAJ3576505.1 hypothetical protein NP233_g384 [Leucocoprinus birnbaumii]